LYRGVYPFLFPEAKPDFSKVNWQEDVDRRIKWGLSHAIGLGVLAQGETVVVVQGWKVRLSPFLTRAMLHLANAETSRAVWATPTLCGSSRLTLTTLALATWLNLVCLCMGFGVYGTVAISQETGLDGPSNRSFSGMAERLVFACFRVLPFHLT
jgi:hypothetical protein